MIRWLAIVFVALIVFAAFAPWLEKFGLGRLPGDVRFRFAGRQWFLPFGSGVLIALLGLAVARFL